MELTIEQKRANYLKEMQRDNNIVASELKKYMDELGIQYKIDSSVYIGIKVCNKIIVELTDCSFQKVQLLEKFVEPYLEDGSKPESIQAVDFLRYYSESLHKQAWAWLRELKKDVYGHLDQDLDTAVEQVRKLKGEFKAFLFARTMVSALNHTDNLCGFWKDEVIESKGQMGLF